MFNAPDEKWEVAAGLRRQLHRRLQTFRQFLHQPPDHRLPTLHYLEGKNETERRRTYNIGDEGGSPGGLRDGAWRERQVWLRGCGSEVWRIGVAVGVTA